MKIKPFILGWPKAQWEEVRLGQACSTDVRLDVIRLGVCIVGLMERDGLVRYLAHFSVQINNPIKNVRPSGIFNDIST